LAEKSLHKYPVEINRFTIAGKTSLDTPGYEQTKITETGNKHAARQKNSAH